MNRQIRAEHIRLIDPNGEMLGVVSLGEGLRIAESHGLDLIEISPNADPPVCKILDSGKFKYELQKKKVAAKKAQKIIEVKEIKLRPVTGDHDYGIKINHAKKFLLAGDKVKVSLRFRGREVEHRQLGEDMILRAQNDLISFGKPDFLPKMEGRQIFLILSPLPTKA